MSIKNLKSKPLLWLYIGGGLLIVIAGGLWCRHLATNPERVFWSTVRQGLATRGVTLEADRTSNGSTLHQVVQYSLGVNNLSHGLAVLSQQNTVVRSETLGTPTVDYTRYMSIKTDQKRPNGQPLDFSKILGVWAKGQEGQSQLFQQTVLGTSLPLGGMGLPIGYLSPDKREALMQQIQGSSAYQVSFGKTVKTRKDGRLLYTYDMNLQPVAYVALIKQFAKDLGLHQLDQLNPEDYAGQKSLELLVTVDVHAHHVVEAALPTGAVKQHYGSYDVPVNIAVPQHAISGAELQSLVSKIQQ